MGDKESAFLQSVCGGMKEPAEIDCFDRNLCAKLQTEGLIRTEGEGVWVSIYPTNKAYDVIAMGGYKAWKESLKKNLNDPPCVNVNLNINMTRICEQHQANKENWLQRLHHIAAKESLSICIKQLLGLLWSRLQELLHYFSF